MVDEYRVRSIEKMVPSQSISGEQSKSLYETAGPKSYLLSAGRIVGEFDT